MLLSPIGVSINNSLILLCSPTVVTENTTTFCHLTNGTRHRAEGGGNPLLEMPGIPSALPSPNGRIVLEHALDSPSVQKQQRLDGEADGQRGSVILPEERAGPGKYCSTELTTTSLYMHLPTAHCATSNLNNFPICAHTSKISSTARDRNKSICHRHSDWRQKRCPCLNSIGKQIIRVI